MNNKLTWFIPGLLVTLLLGLLWAMPASAAVAGTIAFKASGATGAADITHVSLNGPAAGDDGFWFQITDADLDPVVDVVIQNDTDAADDAWTYVALEAADAIVLPANATDATATTVAFEDQTGYTWHDVQDSTGDGVVDNRDFMAFDYTGGLTVENGGTSRTPAPVAVTYDRSNGSLTVAGAYHELRYKVKKTTVIGARNGSDQTAMPEVDQAGAVGADISVDSTALDAALTVTAGEDPTAPDTTHIDSDGTLTWVEFLSSKIPDLTTRVIAPAPAGVTADGDDDTAVVAVEDDVKDLIKAYNDGQRDKPLGVTVAVTTVAHDGLTATPPTVTVAGSRQVDAISVTISSDCGDPTGTGARECAVQTGALGPWTIDDNDTATDRTDDTWTNGDANDDVNVVIEVMYVGSADAVYDVTDRRIGEKDEVGRVMVSSNGATADISVLLQETGAATGVFGTTIKICKAGSAPEDATDAAAYCDTTIPSQAGEDDDGLGQVELPVDPDGDTITIRYSDGDPSGTRTARIALDPSGPAFSGASPDSGTADREDEPTLSFTVTDAESGLSSSDKDLGSVYVVAGLYTIGGAEASDYVVYERDELRLTEATDGYTVTVDIDDGTDPDDELNSQTSGLGNEYEIRWWAVAVDKAGNIGVSDQNAATSVDDAMEANMLEALDDFADDLKNAQTANAEAIITALEGTIEKQVGKSDDDNYVAGKGYEPYVIRVDSAAPALSSAETGKYLDGDEEKSNKATSIVAIFTEDLDCDTVSADDFTVDGAAPNGLGGCKGMKVYLDVDELDTNSTPKVEVASGAVSDNAGNATAAAKSVTATDAISANLTVTVTGTGEGDRPVTKDTVTVTITSDERLKGRPMVAIHRVEDDYGLGNSNKGNEAAPTGTANEWSYTTKISGANDDGLYNVYVTGEDRVSSGMSTKGLKAIGTEDKLKDAKAILFEVDNGVQAPMWLPEANDAGDHVTDDPNVFIRANFANEGKEYGLEASKVVNCTKPDEEDMEPVDGKCADGYASVSGMVDTDDPTKVATDFDTHATVTLVSAKLDGMDVTEDVNSRDNILFLYRPGSLSQGDHKFEIVVTDNAGNGEKTTHPLNFTVTERKPFKVELNAGPNLVSLPAPPVDGDINEVFGSEENITTVVTFDNISSLWMTASRGADGMFMGDLTTIDANHGYWVVSDSVVDINVKLAVGGLVGVTPPAIPISKGWNLVPVADTTQGKVDPDGDDDLKAGEILAKDYFANIDAEVVYGYDATSGVLKRISAGSISTDKVMVGKAYWVYANSAGIIIP